MENEYRFEFLRFHFSCDPIKPKHYTCLRNCIEQSQLSNFLTFDCEAIISFDEDDKAHRYPIISPQTKYMRAKTNCLVYNVRQDNYLSDAYDKIFIYYTEGTNESNYGFVMYNSQTKEIKHKYFIEGKYDILAKTIKQTFQLLYDNQMYDFYAARYDGCKMHDASRISNISDERKFMKQYKPYVA